MDTSVNTSIDLESFKLFYSGKVRDILSSEKYPEYLIMRNTDRLSAFDKVWCDVADKGKILNMTSEWWFSRTSHIIPNHFVKRLNDNDMLVRKCKIFPVEVVVRGYVTGTTNTSLWVNYSKGVRNYCGMIFPDGLVKNQKLAENVVTPTTKGVTDELISSDEIILRGLMTQSQWDYISAKAKELFAFGQNVASSKGFILVDTKYEFGYLDDGTIILADELHTCDSSRYWLKETYDMLFNNNQEPENFDKELVRRYIKTMCDPYTTDVKDLVLPITFQDNVREIYRKFYEALTC